MFLQMKYCFKFLTFFLITFGITGSVFAQLVDQTSQKSHLRWKIKATKELVRVSKKASTVTIQSLDPDFFERFSADVAKLKKNNNYHAKYIFTAPKVPGSPYKLNITLKDDSIELFSFYKREQGGYILDFWINQDVVATKESSLASTPKIVKVAKLNRKKIVKKKKPSNKVSDVFGNKNNNKFNIINPEDVIDKQTGKKFRDFRYGAAFIWDYKAQIPPLASDISLKEKAPDFLFKIKDRTHLDDKKEAHMQLNINFYRKSQWGLMTRSILLYEERYGRDTNKVLNDFMKAVSMIKNTIKNKVNPAFQSKLDAEGEIIPAETFSDKGVFAAARNILTGIVDSTKDYDLNKSILRYLIQYSRNESDYIQTLNYAKSLYVKASETFDDEMIIFSSRIILNSLANLRQLDKIKSFLANKAVSRVLPKQEGLAYIGFVNLFQDNTNQVISDFKVNQASLANPIHPSILFNTAEAYFRQAQYKKAIKLFDSFLNKYSFYSESGQARLRIALSYDLLGEKYSKVIRLYKDAINKSSSLTTRYEAKLRYVGLRVCRNKTPNENDLETIVFLDGSVGEKKSITPGLKKLLWLTRLRSMIASKKYNDALAYLTALPIDNLRRVDQRSFYADGAEIVLGIIQDSYLKGDFARAVKVWEVYKNKYENKVAKSPYMNFIVSDSFIKLSLYDSYERSVKELKDLRTKASRTFPLWVKPHKNIKLQDYLVELNLNYLLKQGKYKELDGFLEKNKANKNINYKYYNGLVSYNLKKYNNSVTSFESLLVNPNINNILTPNQSLRMLEIYLESLYETASTAKFRKNAAALTNDLRRNNKKEYVKIVTRADYLYIESLYSEQKVNYKLLGVKTNEFINGNEKSEYLLRVKYLGGVALLNTDDTTNGRKLLEEILNDKETPDYLKGLARSELTTLTLKNKTL
jgi:tetratricopeptide (TPR) repeat protein